MDNNTRQPGSSVPPGSPSAANNPATDTSAPAKSDTVCLAGYTPRKLDDVLAYAATKDIGAAIAAADLLRDQVAYIPELDQWLCRQILDPETGHMYLRPDIAGLRSTNKITAVADLYGAAADRLDQERQTLDPKSDRAATLQAQINLLRRAAGRVQTESGIKATGRLLRVHVSISPDRLDANPDILTAKNGTINLKNGQTRPGRMADSSTRICGADYLGLDYRNELLDKVLMQIYRNDIELMRYVFRWLGQSCYGHSRLQEMMIWLGDGADGKSLLQLVISYALGDYAGPIPPALLLEKKFLRDENAPTPSIVDLMGLRLAFASETAENHKLDTAQVKRLSGSDQLKGRAVQGRKQIEFLPTHNLILTTNHLPRAPAGEFSFWRRLRVVKFEQRFVDNPDPDKGELPADPDLAKKLCEPEPASAMLSYLVRGALEARHSGLNPPPQVLAATNDYRTSSDLVEQWQQACCEPGAGYTMTAKDARDSFLAWFREEISEVGTPPGIQRFSRELRKFYPRKQNSYGRNIYIGAQIKC